MTADFATGLHRAVATAALRTCSACCCSAWWRSTSRTRSAATFGIVVIGVDEVLVFAMIWMVMVGMILVTAERSHIALEFLARAPARARAHALDLAPSP